MLPKLIVAVHEASPRCTSYGPATAPWSLPSARLLAVQAAAGPVRQPATLGRRRRVVSMNQHIAKSYDLGMIADTSGNIWVNFSQTADSLAKDLKVAFHGLSQ